MGGTTFSVTMCVSLYTVLATCCCSSLFATDNDDSTDRWKGEKILDICHRSGLGQGERRRRMKVSWWVHFPNYIVVKVGNVDGSHMVILK